MRRASSSLLATQFTGVHWTVATFGAPRVGDGAFARFVDTMANLDHYRVTNRSDPVVNVLTLNYAHSGFSIWLSPGIRYTEPEPTEAPSIGDHAIDSYCLTLQSTLVSNL